MIVTVTQEIKLLGLVPLRNHTENLGDAFKSPKLLLCNTDL